MTAGTVYSGSHWQRYATGDTDEAHAYIRRAFFDVKVRFSGKAATVPACVPSRPASPMSA